MTGPAPLDWISLALAAGLLLINAGLSLWLSLKLERQLLVAALRTLVQLTVLGYVLVPIFELNQKWLTLGLVLLMVFIASREGLRRVSLTYTGARLDAFVSLLVAALLTTWIGARVVISVEPWWQPQYLIPLAGMILGNALSGISLGLDRCLTQFVDQKRTIEALLALGATKEEAARDIVQDALRTGMVPILNSMSVVGLVTVPGMMTGQLLGGTPPALAARYQIIIMFLIASATALGVTSVVLLARARLFDSEHRLQGERLGAR